MKERLDRENIEALAAYRFQRAEETLKEIPYLKQQGYYNNGGQPSLLCLLLCRSRSAHQA